MNTQVNQASRNVENMPHSSIPTLVTSSLVPAGRQLAQSKWYKFIGSPARDFQGFSLSFTSVTPQRHILDMQYRISFAACVAAATAVSAGPLISARQYSNQTTAPFSNQTSVAPTSPTTAPTDSLFLRGFLDICS
jgi:hypothetical protein